MVTVNILGIGISRWRAYHARAEVIQSEEERQIEGRGMRETVISVGADGCTPRMNRLECVTDNQRRTFSAQ